MGCGHSVHARWKVSLAVLLRQHTTIQSAIPAAAEHIKPCWTTTPRFAQTCLPACTQHRTSQSKLRRATWFNRHKLSSKPYPRRVTSPDEANMEPRPCRLSWDNVLCESCRNAFDTGIVKHCPDPGSGSFSPLDSSHIEWHTITALQHCAALPCRLCALFLANFHPGEKWLEQAISLNYTLKMVVEYHTSRGCGVSVRYSQRILEFSYRGRSFRKA